MEAAEIYNGIAKAVEAAKPAQEFCFMGIVHWSTCMTKSEWSGWAQAIGAMIAIAVAIWVPYGLERRKLFRLITYENLKAKTVLASFLKHAENNVNTIFASTSELISGIDLIGLSNYIPPRDVPVHEDRSRAFKKSREHFDALQLPNENVLISAWIIDEGLYKSMLSIVREYNYLKMHIDFNEESKDKSLKSLENLEKLKNNLVSIREKLRYQFSIHIDS